MILALLLSVVLGGCGAEGPATPTGGSGTGDSTTGPVTTPPATPPTTRGTGDSTTGPATTPPATPGTASTPVPDTTVATTPGGDIEDLTLPPTTTGSSVPVTLTGVPTAGVEPNCWLLDGYLLVGGPPELIASGQRLTVVGVPAPDLVTTCQQGDPLQVDTAAVV